MRKHVLTQLYRRVTRPLVERWLGGLHAGLVVKSLYLQQAARRTLRTGSRIVLDAGCGPGAQLLSLLAGRYPDSVFEGWDLHLEKAAIEEACRRRQLRNLTVTEADLCGLNRRGQYDIIYSIDVLEHIDDYEEVLDRFVAALRPGGLLWLHVPSVHQRIYFKGVAHDEPTIYRPHRAGDDHVREGFKKDQLKQALERRGMTVTFQRYTFGPVTEWFKEVYTLGERRGIKGIGIAMLPFVVSSTLWDQCVSPRRGNGLWLEAVLLGNR